MKRQNIIAVILASLALVGGCTQVEKPIDSAPLVETFLNAQMENGSETKTLLDGEVGDAMRYIKWLPNDSIGVTRYGYSDINHFINICEDTTDIAIFKGYVQNNDTYISFFPYSMGPVINNGYTYKFTLPSVQYYQENSFGKEAYPMVGKKVNSDKYIMFQNLCGVIVINLTGSETIHSITFSAKDADGNPVAVCGEASVDMSLANYSAINMTGSDNVVTLICNDGVTLNPTTPTPFHIVIPPGTYSSFAVTIVTTDGKIMVKESTKYIEIKRSVVTTTGALSLDATAYEEVDLSPDGTANSYIVSEAGVYSFDASVKGNGMGDNAYLSPASAELLWAENLLVVTNVIYDEASKKIKFTTTGYEGNAVIAAKDADGNIIWSWHIWSTDTPAEHTYSDINSNPTGILMDRNLGATSSTPGDVGALGLLYQWGRKDPFMGSSSISSDTPKKTTIKWPNYVLTDETTGTIEYAISHPTIFISRPGNDWLYQNSDSTAYSRWTAKKTIYDPCPPGWRVPSHSFWVNSNISMQDFDNVNKGKVVSGGCDASAWFPVSGNLEWENRLVNTGAWGHYWTCDKFSSYDSRAMRLYNNNYVNDDSNDSYRGHSIRCQKDEEYSNTSIPSVVIDSIATATSTSAEIFANITYSGWSDITERGIIYSTSPDVTAETGTKVASSDAGRGAFSVTIDNLSSDIHYFVRAYASNANGTSYSDEKHFIIRIPYEGESVNLSANGTANSYIIGQAGTYSITPVKGNSEERIENISYAELIWETRGNTNAMSYGELIKSIALDPEGNVIVITADEFKAGNALVAAKDIDDNILWSWHIWFTDFDPEATAQTYPSGAVLMDRNLGALNNSTDVPSYGLLYQWGRKDPFVGSGDGTNTFASTYPADAISFVNTSDNRNNLSYATAHPNHNIMGSTWNYTNQGTTWWGAEKTIYDPCPPGWQIPPLSAWDNYSHGTFTYPLTGGLNEGSSYLGNVNDYSIVWSYTIQDYEWIRTFRTHSGHWQIESGSAADVSCGRSVRCQKITE